MAEEYDGLIVEEGGQPPAPPAAPVVEEPPGVAEPATPDAPVESAPTPPEKPDPVQQRINQLTAARRQAENEAAYWRGQAEAKTPPPQTPTQPSQPQGEPRPEDYETQDAYDAARIDYRVEQKLATQRAADAMQAQHRAEQATIDESVTAWRDREAEVKAQHADYPERITTVGAQIVEHVYWGIKQLGADIPDMILYLSDHPEAIQRLNQTPTHRLGIEMGRMLRQTASTNGSASPPARSAPPPTPKPEPPTPLPGGGHTLSPGFRDTEAAEQARFEAEWNRTSRRR